MKILFIEDNTDLATSMKHHFELQGYTKVDYCNTGSKALSKIASIKYDLIILDIILPDIDGLVVLDKLKAPNSINSKSFVIITTGITHETLIENASKLGANYFVAKPYQFSNLVNILEVVRKILNITSTPCISNENIDIFCDNYLRDYNINENLKGYSLIIQAFNYLISNVNDQNLRITKDIYPFLAKSNSTDVTNIERNIRNAVNSSLLANEQHLTNLSFLLKMKKSYYLSNKYN